MEAFEAERVARQDARAAKAERQQRIEAERAQAKSERKRWKKKPKFLYRMNNIHNTDYNIYIIINNIKRWRRKLNARTKSGQPVMQYQMEYILKKLQRQRLGRAPEEPEWLDWS